ncbi:hypothetical protein BTO06_11715 [Tenacibaculum sp. SZ-18]|uniref:hypothetical protein n=1 Tax=Tenacibaculum sp. SZ-18 TaxID=754423 RepID=UPI000C2CFE6F|nr:hypothetical protein [Tenacibaculum sp. SZ-18]AUC15775.1 hypothetical protein BTO06_11715 [Tenacibaculum sp. SZ-18]
MGYQSIVHGRILLDRDFKESQSFINSLGNDNTYPQLNTDMFGIGITEPTYYEDPVIVFGATYKQIEYDWTSFILKFEHILRNVGFDTAKIQLETEILGTYNFFWKSKYSKDSFDSEEKLIETDEWFFGYGNRGRWGFLETQIEDFQIFDFENFKYPIEFSDDQKNVFTKIINSINEKTEQKFYPYKKEFHFRETYDLLFPILNKLSFERKIDFGFDEARDKDGNSIMTSKGFYIIMKQGINKETLANTVYKT